MGPIVAPPLPTCCGEALPAGVIKICTGFNSGSNCISGIYTSSTYDTVGYLKDAQPNWTNGSGCDGWDPLFRLLQQQVDWEIIQLPAILILELCVLRMLLTVGHTIGGFALESCR